MIKIHVFIVFFFFFQLKIIPKFSSLVIISKKTMTELTIDRDGSACHTVAELFCRETFLPWVGSIPCGLWLSCGSHDQPRYSSRIREWAKLLVGVSVGLCSSSEYKPRPSIKRRSLFPAPPPLTDSGAPSPYAVDNSATTVASSLLPLSLPPSLQPM